MYHASDGLRNKNYEIHEIRRCSMQYVIEWTSINLTEHIGWQQRWWQQRSAQRWWQQRSADNTGHLLKCIMKLVSVLPGLPVTLTNCIHGLHTQYKEILWVFVCIYIYVCMSMFGEEGLNMCPVSCSKGTRTLQWGQVTNQCRKMLNCPVW